MEIAYNKHLSYSQVLTYPPAGVPAPPEDDGKMQVPEPSHNSKDYYSEQFLQFHET
jgi:hypothetical protein